MAVFFLHQYAKDLTLTPRKPSRSSGMFYDAC